MQKVTFAKDFLFSKVTWVAITAIVAALSGYFSGVLDYRATIAAIIYALMQAFQRDSTAKLKEEVVKLAEDIDAPLFIEGDGHAGPSDCRS